MARFLFNRFCRSLAHNARRLPWPCFRPRLTVLVLAAALAGSALNAHASTAPARRLAIVVGANEAPPGRSTLRYAHADAREVAAALVDVAAFAPGDVHVLLDPAPEVVLRRLDAALATLENSEEALLFFYFSGHSDTAALYPDGRPLPLDELKRRLEDPRVSLRVGVVDACSGGAWTGAKGIREAEPFVVQVPFTLGAEGSALLAASSGAENAHEYERLGGSFFTHHLVAGLRGGAERNGDGVVTLDEAFEYAKAGTLRDSAIYAASPQHPSFVKNLRGRADIPLAHLAGAPPRVELAQQEGPLQVIRLDQALVVLETPPGPREMTLALPPGKYLLRRRSGDQTFAAEVKVASGQALRVRETSLTQVDTPVLRAKAAEPLPPTLRTSLPAGTWEVQFALGEQRDAWVLPSRSGPWFAPGLTVGLTDRVELGVLPLPRVSYRIGEAHSVELLTHLGIGDLPVTSQDGLLAVYPFAGLQLRVPLSADHAFVAGVSAVTSIWFSDSTSVKGERFGDFEEWLASFEAGLLLRPIERLVLSPGIAAKTDRGSMLEESEFAIIVGSALDLHRGFRPLAQFELGNGFFLDGHAAIAFEGPPPIETRTRWGLGATWVF